MRKLMLPLFVFMLASFPLMTTAQTDDLQAELDAIVASYAEDDVAMTVQVTTPFYTLSSATGLAFDDQPTTPNDRFRIGSMSKTYVAALVLMLVEDDYFSLDDLAADYLPDDVISNIANADQVTLRQLLAMRSGIPDYLEMDEFWFAVEDDPYYEWTVIEALEYAYGEPALFAPDEAYYYSNSNYLLIELVIEEVTGQGLHEVMREYILEPLGLDDTYTQVSETLPGGFVDSYQDFYGDGELLKVSEFNDGAGLADGGLISTVGDITLFYQALLQRQILLNPDSLNEMLTFLPDDTGEGEYGLGINRYLGDWGTELGHGGGVVGFSSAGAYYTKFETIIVVLVASEDIDVENIVEDVAELLFIAN